YEPENTLASFRKALELGVDGIELDVYFIDGHLLVFHDEQLERTTNGKGLLLEHDFARLRTLDAGNGEQIPTLPEVFAVTNGRASLNIELKGKDTAGPVVEFISGQRQAGWPNELFLVSSLDRQLLRKVRQLDTQILLGVLVDDPLQDHLDFAAELQAYSLHPPLAEVKRSLVKEAHDLGLKVFVYTVNETEDLGKMAIIGVDGVFSNYPDRVPRASGVGPITIGWL
ncbi:MAG: glycerophosphodiester phosphodiesterase family protein, partial [Thermodesulfobacteriota bacterium]